MLLLHAAALVGYRPLLYGDRCGCGLGGGDRVGGGCVSGERWGGGVRGGGGCGGWVETPLVVFAEISEVFCCC